MGHPSLSTFELTIVSVRFDDLFTGSPAATEPRYTLKPTWRRTTILPLLLRLLESFYNDYSLDSPSFCQLRDSLTSSAGDNLLLDFSLLDTPRERLGDDLSHVLLDAWTKGDDMECTIHLMGPPATLFSSHLRDQLLNGCFLQPSHPSPDPLQRQPSVTFDVDPLPTDHTRAPLLSTGVPLNSSPRVDPPPLQTSVSASTTDDLHVPGPTASWRRSMGRPSPIPHVTDSPPTGSASAPAPAPPLAPGQSPGLDPTSWDQFRNRDSFAFPATSPTQVLRCRTLHPGGRGCDGGFGRGGRTPHGPDRRTSACYRSAPFQSPSASYPSSTSGAPTRSGGGDGRVQATGLPSAGLSGTSGDGGGSPSGVDGGSHFGGAGGPPDTVVILVVLAVVLLVVTVAVTLVVTAAVRLVVVVVVVVVASAAFRKVHLVHHGILRVILGPNFKLILLPQIPSLIL